MATRTIENKRDRIATILIAPFMTCSARLPVYTLVIAAFIPRPPAVRLAVLGTRAAAMLGLYLLGFLAAVVHGACAEIVHPEERADAVPAGDAVLPLAHARSLGLRLIDRSKVFLRRAGTIILLVTVVLWVLAHLPLIHGQPPAIADSLAGTRRPYHRAGDQAARVSTGRSASD